MANADLARHFSINIGMHRSDIRFFQKQMAFRGKDMLENYQAEMVLKDHDQISVGTLKIEVIHTPGHTPGSVCFKMGKNLFSGDTLFVGNAGRTDLPGGDIHMLINSIHSRLTTLPDDTILYPGHDYGPTPVSTIGREKKENLYITDFI